MSHSPAEEARKSEIKAETFEMQVVCSLMVIVGFALMFIEGPQFHHGLMIGVGSTMVLLSGWRKRALLGR